MRNGTVFLSWVLVACGGGGATEPTTESTSGAETERLVIAPVQILDPDGQGITIEADGTLRVAGQTLGRWTADGQLLDEAGTARISIDDTDAIRDAHGGLIAQFEGDRIRVGEHTLEVGVDGVLRGPPAGAPELRLVPSDSPARRVALAALALWLHVPVATTNEATSDSAPAVDGN